MGRWIIEKRAWQQILTHYCDHVRNGDSNQVLRQDIGGGYIRCERCGETFLPESVPGNPRLLMRVLFNPKTDEKTVTEKTEAEKPETETVSAPPEFVHN